LTEPGPGSGGGTRRDLARTTFGVLAIGLLLAASLWILRPFLGPTIWATMVVVATWPLMLKVQVLLWNRRALAVTAMTLLLLLLFVVPLVLAIVTIVGNADRLVDWAKLATEYKLPDAAPAWIVNLPLVGSMIEGLWQQAAALGVGDLLRRLTPYAGDLTKWFVSEVGSIGVLLFQFLLTVIIAAVLYAHGEEAADQARRFARRLGGERGDNTVVLAGGAIRGVALGVGVTALVQAVLGGIGVAIAGVPFATLLAALMFMLCIAQVGPVPVMLGAAGWAFYNDSTGWAIFLAAWGLFVGTLDNFLRPWLIKLGADLPLLLIFAGVIGGLFAFGLVGIFVGPVLLAVAYTLLEAWIHEPAAEPPAPPAPPAPPEFRD
jgi:predicted PurR-regulated permease PerM